MIQRTIYIRIPLKIEADTENGVKECIHYAINRGWFDMVGAGMSGGYRVKSGKPILDERQERGRKA